jgi:hypothetical protein
MLDESDNVGMKLKVSPYLAYVSGVDPDGGFQLAKVEEIEIVEIEESERHDREKAIEADTGILEEFVAMENSSESWLSVKWQRHWFIP